MTDMSIIACRICGKPFTKSAERVRESKEWTLTVRHLSDGSHYSDEVLMQKEYDADDR